jgi:hypothetical protein
MGNRSIAIEIRLGSGEEMAQSSAMAAYSEIRPSPIRFFNRSHNQYRVRHDIADRKKERAVYDHLECTYSWPAAFGGERHHHKCRCGSLRALFVDLNEGTVEDRPTQRFLVAQSIPKFYEYLAGAIPVKAAEGDAVVDQIAAVGNVERGY